MPVPEAVAAAAINTTGKVVRYLGNLDPNQRLEDAAVMERKLLMLLEEERALKVLTSEQLEQLMESMSRFQIKRGKLPSTLTAKGVLRRPIVILRAARLRDLCEDLFNKAETMSVEARIMKALQDSMAQANAVSGRGGNVPDSPATGLDSVVSPASASQQEILLSTHPLRRTPEMHSPVDSVPCDRQEYNVRMERQCKVEIGMDNLAGNGFKIALEAEKSMAFNANIISPRCDNPVAAAPGPSQ